MSSTSNQQYGGRRVQLRRRHWNYFASGQAAFLIVAASSACAGTVKATARNPSASVFSSGGYLNVAAYSEEEGVTNQDVTNSVVFGGSPAAANQYNAAVGLTSQTIAVPNGVKVNQFGKIVPNYTFLGPVAQILGPSGFALNKNQLTSPDDNVSTTSTTGDYSGAASVSNITNPLISKTYPKYQVTAEASGEGPLAGDAAALAGDPVNIPAGTYAYDPGIDASISLSTPTEQGAARAYAVDSSTFTSDSVDNFVADGEPLDEALWSLVIGADTPIAGSSSLEIDFELNPTALNEIILPSSYLLSLGSFSNQTAEAALIDQAVDAAVAGAIITSGGEADLTDFDPFPSGTTYTPITDGEEYADGADAAIADVPEPGSLALLAGAGLCLLRTRRRTDSGKIAL